jgi:predicted metal-dependent phosphoesterase TrpH
MDGPPCADLHIHSNISDGAASPAELLPILAGSGLTHISLTDHDACHHQDEFVQLAAASGLKAITGSEISCLYANHQIHLLAYGFASDSPDLAAFLDELRSSRRTRMEEMLAQLRQMGLQVSADEFFQTYTGPYWGRPQLADYLVNSGYAVNFHDAFARYIGIEGPAYVANAFATPEQVCEIVAAVGGKVFLAHPVHYPHRIVVELLRLLPLDGIEIIHPAMSEPMEQRKWRELADTYGLIISGGSDFHGETSRYVAMGLAKRDRDAFMAFVNT